jgi:L-lactate utilization protein LutB
MGIAAYYDEIAQCNKCGFCQVACPIFRATGHESGVARGRLALLRAIIEGRLDWSDDIEAPLFDCLLCGACTSNCFPATSCPACIIHLSYGVRKHGLKTRVCHISEIINGI